MTAVPEPSRLRLPDRRRLAYRLYGPADGRPVFYFHGTGGNGAAPHLERWGAHLGLRFAATDRPGYGHSDFQPRRTILDTAQDTAALADHLGWSRFSCLGVSGGGPYSLAVAHVLRQRVERAVVASGVGPPESPDQGFHPSQKARISDVMHRSQWRLALGLLPQQLRQCWLSTAGAERRVRRMSESRDLPLADRLAVAIPSVRESLVAAMTATRPRDVRGLAWEMRLFTSPWGFDLAGIPGPVDFWIGTSDRSVSPAASRWMADRVPRGTLNEIGGAGHALPLTHWRLALAPLGDRPADD